MTRAPRRLWARSISTAALASIGPRAVAAVALTAAFALLAPNEGSLDTGHRQPDLPDPGALQDPLGISGGLGGVKNLTPSDAVKLASNAEEMAIPPVALAAYQRSATVLTDADGACRLDWALVAAIGMVESNHGRFRGSELNSNGLALPAIIGPQLNGAGGYAVIRDTDSGLYDHDTVYDHAVGPMQFIPSTWTFAGADGDGDNRRDPQDIDDAAVATAAFLCAGSEDVSTDSGARSAVYRYNQSDTYVTAVLKIASQYRNGEFPGSPDVDREAPSTVRPRVSALPATSNTPATKPTTQSEPKAGPASSETKTETSADGASVPPEPSKSPDPSGTGDGNTDAGGSKSDPSDDSSSGPGGDPSGGGEASDGSDPSDGETSEPPPPADEATEETLRAPCESATDAVYGNLKEVDLGLYTRVVDSCVGAFLERTVIPESAELELHVFDLSESTDVQYAGLTPVKNPRETEADGASDSETAG